MPVRTKRRRCWFCSGVGARRDLFAAAPRPAAMTLLDVDIAFRYPGGGATIECAWKDPVGEPRVTVFLGSSGSGKTTILRCLAGLERPHRGHIRFGDRTWFDASQAIQLPPDRRGLGFLFQDYALFPHMTVERNIAFAGLGGGDAVM